MRKNDEDGSVSAVDGFEPRRVAGALMIPGALSLRRHYKDLTLPVVIIARDGDKVVFKRRSMRLRDSIPGSRLEIVKGAGHMVHHVATWQVARAVENVTPGW